MFVLIDPILGEPIALPEDPPDDEQGLNQARELAWGRKIHTVELASKIDLPKPLHPYLVALNGRDDPWLESSLGMALNEWRHLQSEGIAGTGVASMRIAGWLSTSMHAHQLCRSLRDLLQVKTAASTTARYLRLADRRVLDWWACIVGPSSVAPALNRIQRWHYLDGRGMLATLSGQETQPPLEVQLSKAQWASLMKGALLHPTLARWIAGAPDASVWRNQSTPDLYQQLAVALDSAEAASKNWPHRFTQSSDFTAWAALQLSYRGFGESAFVRERLTPLADDDGPAASVHMLSMELAALVQTDPSIRPGLTTT